MKALLSLLIAGGFVLHCTTTLAQSQEGGDEPATEVAAPSDKLNVSIFSVGQSTLNNLDDAIELEGTHVGITGLDFHKVTNFRAALFYHYADKKQGSMEYKVYMPELSLNLDANILALPTIRRAMPSPFDLALMAAAGFGIGYLPYYYQTAYDSTTANQRKVRVEHKKWYWDHAAWNVHISGGLILDRELGGIISMFFYNPISGRPRFETIDLRIGLVYKL